MHFADENTDESIGTRFRCPNLQRKMSGLELVPQITLVALEDSAQRKRSSSLQADITQCVKSEEILFVNRKLFEYASKDSELGMQKFRVYDRSNSDT